MIKSVGPAMPSIRKHALTFLACVLAAAGACTASRLAFCRAPVTTDENSCIFQANNFLDGMLFRPFPGVFAPQLNQKHIIYDDERGMFSRYAPGRIIWLMPGVVFGNPYCMSAIGAAPSNSLLFVTPCPLADYMINNPRGVESDPLAMLARPGIDKTAIPFLPEKTPYYLYQHGTSFAASFSFVPADVKAPYALTISAGSMSRLTGIDVSREGAIRGEARQDVHEKGWFAFGRRANLFPGRFIVRYGPGVSGCPDGETACILDVAANGGRTILAEKRVTGAPGPEDLALEFAVQDFVGGELRVYCNGVGDISLASISICEAPG